MPYLAVRPEAVSGQCPSIRPASPPRASGERGRALRAWLVAALLAFGAGLPGAHAQGAPEPIRVVATFSILADMVREVGGDRIALQTIVGPNGDAHAFEPAPRDARALGQARLLVRNGLGFEGWLPRLLEASGFKGLDVVASEGVRPRILNGEEQAREAGEHGGHGAGGRGGAGHGGHEGVDHVGDIDPHAWQDLSNGVIYVRNIARGLAAADPAHADEYRLRAQAYAARLREEDRAWRASLAAIPPAHRVMMSSHDAFGYLGRAYGIELISVLGLSSEAEPAAGTIARLVDRIRARGIHAVFLEKAVNPTLMQRIVQETGARIGGTLYSDTLDAPGTPAGTYLGMFRWNAQHILEGLRG
ncbi:zinc ABC transporter substrate-binding protein [Castellaniella sp. GW247-6E4]|uniref:metal ABC transporter solute-binding protein, Zn/Mn family n=1 Tax=Castellaniella sp. GW247-6E4 TaxID=3140380 RepID=UPI00331593FB